MSSVETNDATEEFRLSQGLKPIDEMSDREIAAETLYWMRFAGQVMVQMQNGGVGKMMMSMMGARK